MQPEKEPATTIFDALVRDHRKIEALLERIDRTVESPGSREGLMIDLSHELVRHTRAEEDVYYSALRKHRETEAIANQGNQEHSACARLLLELDTIGTDEPRWAARFLELKDAIERHFEIEERGRFRQARQVLSEAESADLAKKFRERCGALPEK